jgi:DNA mismatch repair protein MutS2
VIPLPDLLNPRPTAPVDERLLEELLEMSYLGSDPGYRIDRALEDVPLPPSPWNAEFFADGLFLDELIEGCFAITLEGKRFPVHRRFLRRVLSRPPVDLETLRLRQGVLEELETDAATRAAVTALYRRLFDLLSAFKAPGLVARLDQTGFRLDILRQAKAAIDAMVDDFGNRRSALARLHEVGLEIQAGHDYEVLAALLDHEGRLADLKLEVRLGADGKIRRLGIAELVENTGNRFHRPPGRRWRDRMRLAWRGYGLDSRELVNRLIVAVYEQVAPALRTLLQVLGQLEVYLGSLAFAELARERGLEVCLATPSAGGRLALERLFNPLLLRGGGRPVPCDLAPARPEATVLITGANSGGKTRMLQAVGLAQVLGQSGLHVAARRAEMPIFQGLFVSLIEEASADQTEGRLGAELLRIRRLFEEARPGSLILLDELCSGTNPSEAVEIVAIVLDLLRRLRPIALVTTHFLDYTRRLQAEPPGPELEFLHAVSGPDHRPTYQFAPGVAETSLAADTARRLGVTFEGLAALLAGRLGASRDL